MDEIVYTPASDLRRPGRLLRELWDELRGSRELAWRLTVRDIQAKYRHSFLGYLWAFAGPLGTTVTFALLNDQRVISVAETPIPYPAHVLIGTILWGLFAESLTSGLQQVKGARGLLSKIRFPREALVLTGLAKVGFNFIIRGVLLVAVLVVYGITPGPELLMLPVAVVGLMLLGSVLGLLVLPLAILIEDVDRAITFLLGFWFFLTPVIYPVQEEGLLATITSVNPVTPLLETGRQSLVGAPLDSLAPFAVVTGVCLLLLVLVLAVYRLAMPILIERMNA